MNDDEREQLDLPANMLAELQSQAANRGCTPQKLIDEMVEQAMQRGPAYWEEMAEIVRAIDDAAALGIPAPWPESFEDRLVVRNLLDACIERSSETVLLETSGPEMDAIEEICRMEGISYEEFTRRAIDAFLAL